MNAEMVRLMKGAELHLEVAGTTPGFLQAVVQRLTLQNPKYVEAERYGRWRGNIPRELRYFRRTADRLIVPRGTLPIVLALTREHGLPVEVEHATVAVAPIEFERPVPLSDAQQDAVEQLLRYTMGHLVAPPGGGKTNIALEVIRRRQQPTLWLTHTKELANQTRARAHDLSGMPASGIGEIGDGKCTIGRRLTIGMMQTLARRIPDQALTYIGHVVVEECHHVPAEMTARVLAQLPAAYLLGLTATPYRRDGLGQVIGFYWDRSRHAWEQKNLRSD